MFHLITGTPGAGKTLSIIAKLKDIKDRPIYYFGIPDLSPDLGWIELSDPKTYHDQLPYGSIFVLDECQQHFPVRSPSSTVPPGISFIETHRHRGIDLYFITQHPSLLDHHARRLVGHHSHYQRNFGMGFSVCYTNNKLFDYSSYHELKSCAKTIFKHPRDVFGLYKSAEVHTHRPKFPKKFLIIPVLLLMIGFGVYTVYSLLHKKDDKSQSSVPNIVKSSLTGTQSLTSDNQPRDWSRAFIPAVPGLPYTAPIYKDLAKPKVMPVVAGCVATKTRCQCYTQQATKIDMDPSLCRLNVKNTAFNPFKDSQQQIQQFVPTPLPQQPVSSNHQPLPPMIVSAYDDDTDMEITTPRHDHEELVKHLHDR